MAQEVEVRLEDRSYTIRIGNGLLDGVGEVCRTLGGTRRALVVTDSHVGPLYGARVRASLESAGYTVTAAVVEAGEEAKCGRVLFDLYDRALDAGLDRTSLVVALGGGVVGDLAGYLAASYMRGIPFVQVPTTLLAMVDSSVGGKTGINLPRGKNLVGAFHQPGAVVADLDTLATLPAREIRSGMAEVIKYGLIYDAGLFERLERAGVGLASWTGSADGAENLVARCCAIKAEVVSLDEREGGLRAILNFGHTLGHAIEAVAGYGAFLHGEAVAVGMVYAARLSGRMLALPAADVERVRGLCGAAGLPVRAPGLSWDSLVGAMAADKKSAARVPRFVLLSRLGEARPGVEVGGGILREEARHVLGE